MDHKPNRGHKKSAHTNRISRSNNRMNVPELLYNAHISSLFHLEIITAASGYILKQSKKQCHNHQDPIYIIALSHGLLTG